MKFNSKHEQRRTKECEKYAENNLWRDWNSLCCNVFYNFAKKTFLLLLLLQHLTYRLSRGVASHRPDRDRTVQANLCHMCVYLPNSVGVSVSSSSNLAWVLCYVVQTGRQQVIFHGHIQTLPVFIGEQRVQVSGFQGQRQQTAVLDQL